MPSVSSRDSTQSVNDLPYGSARLATWRRRTDTPLTALALGSLPILLLEFVSDRLTDSDRFVITSVNILVFAAFLTDYVVELSVARDRKDYFVHEWTSLLIVLSQGLALLPALGVLGALRIIRGLKPLIFFVRIASIGSAEAHELKRTLKTRAASTALSVAGLVWITSAVAFTLVEEVGVGRRVGSFGDALWWSATTISTVGYGDVYPITIGGRIIAVFTMIVGVSTFGVLTASIARSLLGGSKQNETN
jgi:voltage-gated potassium channel